MTMNSSGLVEEKTAPEKGIGRVELVRSYAQRVLSEGRDYYADGLEFRGTSDSVTRAINYTQEFFERGRYKDFQSFVDFRRGDSLWALSGDRTIVQVSQDMHGMRSIVYIESTNPANELVVNDGLAELAEYVPAWKKEKMVRKAHLDDLGYIVLSEPRLLEAERKKSFTPRVHDLPLIDGKESAGGEYEVKINKRETSIGDIPAPSGDKK